MRLMRSIKLLFLGLLSFLGIITTAYADDILNSTPGVTPISPSIYNLRMTIFWVCVAIVIVVFSIMFYALIRHRKSLGVKPATFHGNIRVELFWAIIPFLILVIMAVPAILVVMRNTTSPSITITNKSWTLNALLHSGEDLYNSQCAACHKPDGAGMPPAFPALKGSKIATGPVKNPIDMVLYGKPGTAMPAFAGQLNDADIAAIITYVRNSWGNADTNKYGKNAGGIVQPADVAQARKQ